MSGFSYKPALLAGRRDFEVTEAELICRDDRGGELWRLDLNKVGSAAFVEHKVRDARLRRLDLVAGTVHRSIGFNGGGGDPAADPNAAAHLELCAAVLDRLSERDGGLQVSVGEYGRARIAIFAIGLLSSGGAIGLLIAALASGISGARLGTAAVPLGLMVVFGGALILANAPWRGVPKVPARAFAAALRGIARPGKARR